MPKYHHEFDQYSAQWEHAHRGIASSSSFDKIITPGMKPSTSWKGYCHNLIAERLLGRRMESFSSPYMDRGLEYEAEAVSQYEFMRDVETQTIGLVLTDDGNACCSPDRLVGEDGLLEIKVPKPNTQVEYLLSDELQKAYWPQLQGQLFVTGREWVDIMAYHPEMPPVISRVVRDAGYIDCMEVLLKKAVSYMDEKMAFITALYGDKNE